jgi:hypothetical protein
MLRAKTVNEDSCPCEPGTGRKAVGVDSEIKASNLRYSHAGYFGAGGAPSRRPGPHAQSPLSLRNPLHPYRVAGREAGDVRRTARDDLQERPLTTNAGGRSQTASLHGARSSFNR